MSWIEGWTVKELLVFNIFGPTVIAVIIATVGIIFLRLMSLRKYLLSKRPPLGRRSR
jgi:hypothetical protein